MGISVSGPSNGGGGDKKEIINMIYPIGSIYISVNNINPGTLFGGTWVSFGTGRTLVGVNSGDNDFKTTEKTGGEKTHTLNTNEIPAHTHGQAGPTGGFSIYALARKSQTALIVNHTGPSYTHGQGTPKRTTSTQENISGSTIDSWKFPTAHTHASVGAGYAHNNMPPYICVYMWKRTA